MAAPADTDAPDTADQPRIVVVGGGAGRGLPVEGKLATLFHISLYRMQQHAIQGIAKTALKAVVDGINNVLWPCLKLH